MRKWKVIWSKRGRWEAKRKAKEIAKEKKKN